MAISPRWLAASAAGLILMATGCAESGSNSDGIPGTWGGTGDGAPQLVLADDGTLTGTDGCNTLNGTWTAEGADVTFGPVASTRMACEGVDTWLSEMTTATVDSGTMLVMNADGIDIGTLGRQ